MDERIKQLKEKEPLTMDESKELLAHYDIEGWRLLNRSQKFLKSLSGGRKGGRR